MLPISDHICSLSFVVGGVRSCLGVCHTSVSVSTVVSYIWTSAYSSRRLVPGCVRNLRRHDSRSSLQGSLESTRMRTGCACYGRCECPLICARRANRSPPGSLAAQKLSRGTGRLVAVSPSVIAHRDPSCSKAPLAMLHVAGPPCSPG